MNKLYFSIGNLLPIALVILTKEGFCFISIYLCDHKAWDTDAHAETKCRTWWRAWCPHSVQHVCRFFCIAECNFVTVSETFHEDTCNKTTHTGEKKKIPQSETKAGLRWISTLYLCQYDRKCHRAVLKQRAWIEQRTGSSGVSAREPVIT